MFHSSGKIRFVSGDAPSKLTAKLKALKFDQSDRVFVGVAFHSGKRLLAEESDYTPAVISALKVHSILVYDCTLAAHEIKPN